MRRLTLWLDPELTRPFGAEIAWTWRLVLSTAGILWEEVGADRPEGDVDVSYVSRLTPETARPRARLEIEANPRLWSRPENLRLVEYGRSGSMPHLVFADTTSSKPAVSASSSGRRVLHDIIFDVFWFAVHREENFWPRNVHGHLNLEASVFLERHLFTRAVGSEILAAAEDLLLPLLQQTPVARWPAGKTSAVCVSHDVDYPEIVKAIEPFRMLRRNGMRAAGAIPALLSGRRHHWHFDSWVREDAEFGVRSAFYFSARRGSLREYAMGTPDPFYDINSPKFGALFRYLRDEGFEVGLHASYWSHQDRSRLEAERTHLEEASGGAVSGGRHHYFSLDRRQPSRTLTLHGEIGLAYDSSFAHDAYPGWRSGLSSPYFPFDAERRSEVGTLQIPMPWMDAQPLLTPPSGDGPECLRLERLVDTVYAQQGCLMLDVHEYVFDAVLFPGWRERYRDLMELVRARAGFWFARPDEVAAFRRTRYESIRNSSSGLR